MAPRDFPREVADNLKDAKPENPDAQAVSAFADNG